MLAQVQSLPNNHVELLQREVVGDQEPASVMTSHLF